ncbi:hypothetical protein HOD38_02920 [archaeon]|jgi:hypothetical protein|nr:hypothetical protein [archaeon]MBT4440574.1 hypothetical protein [archaeon]
MSEKVHKRMRREARALEEQAQADRPSLLERLPSVPSLGVIDAIGPKVFAEHWTKVRNRYFIPGTIAATVLILASPALLPTTSYREIGRELASSFQSDEPDYNALFDQAEQNLYGRPAKTQEEIVETYNAVSSGKFSNQEPMYEIREATITNQKPNLRDKIREQVHYITDR